MRNMKIFLHVVYLHYHADRVPGFKRLCEVQISYAPALASEATCCDYQFLAKDNPQLNDKL